MFDTILQTASSLPWTQWVAFITGIIYVVLAARENIACWIFGIISCAFIAWDDFTRYLLYADGVLQVFYVLIGIYGLYQWKYGRDAAGRELGITEKPLIWHIRIFLLGVILSIPVGYLLNLYSAAQFAYLDSLTTTFSFIATFLLVRKILSNWIYWIIIDLIYCYLFFMREGYLIALLYFIFCFIAIFGYFNWKRLKRDTEVAPI